jgi:hypothetical protein
MRTPSRIATVPTIALIVTSAFVRLLTERRGLVAKVTLVDIAIAALVVTVLGLATWVGTYLGARIAKPIERTNLFANVLAVAYVAIAVVISIPMPTRVIKLDSPTSGSTSRMVEVAAALVVAIVASLLVVIIALVVTRILAVICNVAVIRRA